MGLDAVVAAVLFLAAVFRPERIRNRTACWIAIGLLAAATLLHGLCLAVLAVQFAAFCGGVLDAAGLIAAAVALIPRPSANVNAPPARDDRQGG